MISHNRLQDIIKDDFDTTRFADLSDGERQLLMVLGLIVRPVESGPDEPDTYLNPLWQLSYLDLIREWTGVAAEADKCQIILTSHNPLTIAALERDEVRVMMRERDKTTEEIVKELLGKQ